MVRWKRRAYNIAQETNVRRWMQDWQAKFSEFDVEVIVADVGQSSIVVNAAERMIVLAPSLKLSAADRMLDGVHRWWQRQVERMEEELCVLLSR